MNKKLVYESLYLVWMGLLPLLASGFLGYFALSNPAFFTSFSLLSSVVFWICAALIMGLALCPTTFFALFTGYVYGFSGLLPLILAYSAASALGYFLAKQFGATALLSRVPSSFLANVRSSSFSWVFLARLSPIFPFAITNAIMAFVGVRFRWFITAGTLGMLPRTFLAVFTGISASSWGLLFARPELLRWQDVVSVVLLLVSAVGMYVLGRRSMR